MNEGKIKSIINAMDGLTYGDWNKLKHVIDVRFSAEASKIANKTVIASADEIVEEYKRLF